MPGRRRVIQEPKAADLDLVQEIRVSYRLDGQGARRAKGRRNLETAVQSQDIDLSQFTGHPIELDSFHGPLDFLLHLIKKDQIEIWEISVSRITRQYLGYISELQKLNIEVADTPDELAETILRLLGDPVRRADLGRAGRKTVIESCSWNQRAREMEDLLLELAGVTAAEVG